MIRRRELLRAGLGTASALLVAGAARAQAPNDDSDPAALIAKMGPMMSKIPIEVVTIADGLDLIKGAGGNVAVLHGPDGSLVVDSQIPARGKEVFETAKRVGGKPVSTLINTHWHFDHAGGNEFFGRAGAMIIATATTRKRLSTDQYSEAFKMTTPASPSIALPSFTVTDQAEIHVGDETVHLIAVPPAHTDGDMIVHFTTHDVIHTGDLFSNGLYPNIDASSQRLDRQDDRRGRPHPQARGAQDKDHLRRWPDRRRGRPRGFSRHARHAARPPRSLSRRRQDHRPGCRRQAHQRPRRGMGERTL